MTVETVEFSCRATDLDNHQILQWLDANQFTYTNSNEDRLIDIKQLPEGWKLLDDGKSSWPNSPFHIFNIYNATGEIVAEWDSDEGYLAIIKD